MKVKTMLSLVFSEIKLCFCDRLLVIKCLNISFQSGFLLNCFLYVDTGPFLELAGILCLKDWKKYIYIYKQ